MVLKFVICFQPPPIKPTDNQLTLADVDVIKVVGKGNGGVVQLVQHKWTSQFFALKVLLLAANCALNLHSLFSYFLFIYPCIGLAYPYTYFLMMPFPSPLHPYL